MGFNRSCALKQASTAKGGGVGEGLGRGWGGVGEGLGRGWGGGLGGVMMAFNRSYALKQACITKTAGGGGGGVGGGAALHNWQTQFSHHGFQ